MTSHSRAFRLSLFAMMYFAQGAMLNFFFNYNSTYLDRGFGIDAASIGMLTAVLTMPFVLKVFVGMLSDRISPFGWGHRKPYMAGGLLLQAAGFYSIPLVSPKESPGAYTLLALAAVTGMALYDTTTDGFALDTTAPAERGLVQGTMVVGRALGFTLLTPFIGMAAEAWGWRSVFTGGALATLLPLPLVFRVREEPGSRSKETFEWGAFRAFARPHILLFSLFGALYTLVILALLPFLTRYFTRAEYPCLGYGPALAGWLFFAMGTGRMLGAVAAGAVTDRFGPYRSAWVALVVTGAGCLGMALLTGLVLPGVPRPVAWTHPAVLALVGSGFLYAMGYSYYDTVYFCGAMAFAIPAIYASMYAIFMAVANIGGALGPAITGWLTGSALGFPAAALLIFLVNLAIIPLVTRIYGKYLGDARGPGAPADPEA